MDAGSATGDHQAHAHPAAQSRADPPIERADRERFIWSNVVADMSASPVTCRSADRVRIGLFLSRLRGEVSEQ